MDDAQMSDAEIIGDKVIEMFDRLKPVDAVCPGTYAKWAFEIDGRMVAVTETEKRK